MLSLTIQGFHPFPLRPGFPPYPYPYPYPTPPRSPDRTALSPRLSPAVAAAAGELCIPWVNTVVEPGPTALRDVF